MSCLCKVEMSGFMGGRGSHGNGANYLESTRTGPVASVARSTAGAFNPGRSGGTGEDIRPPGAPAAVADPRARRRLGDPRVTRAAIEPAASGWVGAEDSGANTPALCGLRTHAGCRTSSERGVRGEPRDTAKVDDQSEPMASPIPAGENHPRVARTASQFRRAGDAG